MNTKIETATLTDAPRIALMAEKVHEENNEPVTDEFRAMLLKGAMDAIMSKTKAVLVATIEKHGKRKIIGMIGIAVVPHPVDKIAAIGDYFYIEPKYRANGVAKQLLDAGEDLARKAGATKAYTEAKVRVKSILERAGYEVENVIMSKLLGIKEEVKKDGEGNK